MLHEIGHIFGLDDQYSKKNGSTTSTTDMTTVMDAYTPGKDWSSLFFDDEIGLQYLYEMNGVSNYANYEGLWTNDEEYPGGATEIIATVVKDCDNYKAEWVVEIEDEFIEGFNVLYKTDDNYMSLKNEFIYYIPALKYYSILLPECEGEKYYLEVYYHNKQNPQLISFKESCDAKVK